MRVGCVLATALALLCLTAGAQASSATSGLSVAVDRAQVSTSLGRDFAFRSTITNAGPRAASGLVAHLSVLSLRRSPYVDPEDWSPQRVVFLDPIPAGASRTLRWPMTAVNAGTFGVYVTVLPAKASGAATLNSPTVGVGVTERRTLNSGGIVPLVIAVPALLGMLALIARLRRRR